MRSLIFFSMALVLDIIVLHFWVQTPAFFTWHLPAVTVLGMLAGMSAEGAYAELKSIVNGALR